MTHDYHPSISVVPLFELSDERGSMSKSSLCSGEGSVLKEIIISETRSAGTVRGLYFQTGTESEGKYIRILSGSATWFYVDLRNNEYFGRVFSLKLKPEQSVAFEIPPGFAHGMVSETNNVRILLGATESYSAEAGHYISFHDPMLIFQSSVLPFAEKAKPSPIQFEELEKLKDDGILPLHGI